MSEEKGNSNELQEGLRIVISADEKTFEIFEDAINFISFNGMIRINVMSVEDIAAQLVLRLSAERITIMSIQTFAGYRRQHIAHNLFNYVISLIHDMLIRFDHIYLNGICADADVISQTDLEAMFIRWGVHKNEKNNYYIKIR